MICRHQPKKPLRKSQPSSQPRQKDLNHLRRLRCPRRRRHRVGVFESRRRRKPSATSPPPKWPKSCSAESKVQVRVRVFRLCRRRNGFRVGLDLSVSPTDPKRSIPAEAFTAPNGRSSMVSEATFFFILLIWMLNVNIYFL